jgi:hypothetical protein
LPLPVERIKINEPSDGGLPASRLGAKLDLPATPTDVSADRLFPKQVGVRVGEKTSQVKATNHMRADVMVDHEYFNLLEI